MIVGLPVRCRYWSVLQVVAIIVSLRGKVSSERVQGCVGSQLKLRCSEKKVINITSVVLGDSNCKGSWCCIRNGDCTRNPNAAHITDVHRNCNDKQSCLVGVLREKITCGYFSGWSNNDFERITYICVEKPQNDSTNTTSDEQPEDFNPGSGSANSTDQKQTTEHDHTEEEQTDKYYDDDGDEYEVLFFVVASMGFIIPPAIVVLVIVICWRCRRREVKTSNPISMTENDDRRDEFDISENESHGISLHENNDPLPLSAAHEAEFPRMEEDSSVVYSEVELRQPLWKDGQRERTATDETKKAIEAHTDGSIVYAAVNKSSETSSTIKMIRVDGKDLVNMGYFSPDQIYSLASNDPNDIYVEEAAFDTSTHLVAGTISKTPSLQDEEDMIVIENDLYGN